MKYLRMLFFMIILISTVTGYPYVDSGFAEEQNPEIVTVPENELFSLENLAPGQSEVKNFIVKTKGNIGFHYQTFVNFKSGSKKLYDTLDVTIASIDNKILYTGKLKDISTLSKRKLGKNTDDRLTIKIGLPSKAGNDFKALTCEVEFQFRTDAESAGIGTDNSGLSWGSNLPNTGTNMFNIFAAGTFLLICGFLLRAYFIKNNA